MADYKYAGLTTYLLENEETPERLVVLAEAIEGIQCDIQHVYYDGEKYKNVEGTNEYKFIYDNDGFCFPDDSECPDDMPHAYKRATVEPAVIKGIPMIRLYVPVVAKNEDTMNRYIFNALPAVISSLFGDDVVSMKSKQCTEHDSFMDAKSQVLISVNHRLTAQETQETQELTAV